MDQELLHFIPSAENGLRARGAIYARLNEGLRHIFEQCSEHVDFDSARADRLVRRIDTGERLPPSLFGCYFSLVRAIQDGSLQQVRESLDTILSYADSPAATFRIRPFNRNGFSSEEESEFRIQFVSESLLDEQLAHLDEGIEDTTLIQLKRAIDLLQRHAPKTFSEMDVYLSELVAAQGIPVNGLSFDGCSSLERWGSILINTILPRTDLEFGEAIVHEAAHNVLFAMAPVDFHVRNDPQERYKSPLRLDLRPMNGIYHATFVLSRMCFAMREVVTSTTADLTLQKEAQKQADTCRDLFYDGYRVLEDHALYTDEGRAIMQATARYMASIAQ
jgi:hypothetical protein